MNGTNYEVPHCGAFSTPHSHPSWAQIFASLILTINIKHTIINTEYKIIYVKCIIINIEHTKIIIKQKRISIKHTIINIKHPKITEANTLQLPIQCKY